MIKQLTKENFEHEIQTGKTVLVDFWATWCGPCKMIAPELENLAAKHEELLIGKVNVDDEPELASSCGISAIPTLMLFKDGKHVDTAVGYRSAQQLEEMLSL